VVFYSLSPLGHWEQRSDLNVNVIAFPSAKTGWAAGPKGMIARWNIETPAGVQSPELEFPPLIAEVPLFSHL